MRASRRFSVVVLIAILGVAAVVTVTAVTVAEMAQRLFMAAVDPLVSQGPAESLGGRAEAAVGHDRHTRRVLPKILGFTTREICRWQLAAGPSSCSCTATNLPDWPIPPGGQATVTVGMTDATKHDTLKERAASRDS